jgi:hypothetical protein
MSIVSVPVLPEESCTVTVTALLPAVSAMPAIVHEAEGVPQSVHEAVPLPPASFTQVTLETAALSEAVPEGLMVDVEPLS